MESLKNKINREDNARERPYDEVRDLLDEAKSKLNKAKGPQICERAERTHEESGKKAQESGQSNSPLRAKEVSGNFAYHLSKKPGCGGVGR